MLTWDTNLEWYMVSVCINTISTSHLLFICVENLKNCVPDIGEQTEIIK